MIGSDSGTVSSEERLRRIEDTLEIYNLIATHPPSADTGAPGFVRKLWAEDAVFKRSDGQGTITLEQMEKQSAGPEHQAAVEGGLAHFCGHPYVRVEGDRALAISYLQLLTPTRDGEPVSIPGHGASKGYFTMKVVANRWDFARTPSGWRVRNRIAHSLDGSAAARELLVEAFDA